MTDTTTSNVVSALAAVIAELPGIGKDGRASQQQGGYAYRGIEQITAHAAPLLAKHGVVFLPQVLDVDVRDITVNSKPWTDTYLTVRYLICGPGGPEDRVEATVVGIGRDNADKGANKALTQAFKYALLQVLCIADAKDDGDGHATHEADDVPTYDPMAGWESRAVALDRHAVLSNRLKGLTDEQRTSVRQQCRTWPMNADDFAAIEAIVDELSAGGDVFVPSSWADGEEPF